MCFMAIVICLYLLVLSSGWDNKEEQHSPFMLKAQTELV